MTEPSVFMLDDIAAQGADTSSTKSEEKTQAVLVVFASFDADVAGKPLSRRPRNIFLVIPANRIGDLGYTARDSGIPIFNPDHFEESPRLGLKIGTRADAVKKLEDRLSALDRAGAAREALVWSDICRAATSVLLDLLGCGSLEELPSRLRDLYAQSGRCRDVVTIWV
jgi:hypothetical protein